MSRKREKHKGRGYRIYPVRAGHVFERMVAGKFEKLLWTVGVDERLDRFEKVDLSLTHFRGSGLRAAIDVQVSLNGSLNKLEAYIRYQKMHRNNNIKVFLFVDNLATPNEVALRTSELFCRSILRDIRPYIGKVWMVHAEHNKGARWVDIIERYKELRERKKQQRNSRNRIRGTIECISKDNRGVVIRNCHNRYFAYHTDIDDKQFFGRFKKGKVKLGTPVTFFPTREKSSGPFFLARCLLPI